MVERIQEVWAYRELLATFVSRDLKLRYRGSVLGFLWSFLDPLVNAVVLWVIFSFLFHRGIENFPLFLLIGILPWNFFSSCLSGGAEAIRGSAALIKKIRLPREVFPLANVLANLAHFFFATLVLLLFLVVARVPVVPLAWLFLPVILLFLCLVNLGGALLVSAVSVYFRDFQFLVASGLRILYFATPIFYPLDFVPDRFRSLYLINPLASVITAFRQVFLEGRVPEISLLASLFAISLLVLALGSFVFGRLEKGFAEEV